MKIIYLILLCCLFSQESLAESKCDGVLDAFLGNYEITRNQYFDKDIGQCIPGLDSIISLKDDQDIKFELKGFVVGIEKFWHKKFSNIVKITTKSGGHTTIVKLLSDCNSTLQEIPGAEFTSNMEYIVLSKEGPEYLQVVTKDNDFEGTSQIVVETIYQLINGKMSKVSTENIK